MLPDFPEVRKFGEEWLKFRMFVSVVRRTGFMQRMRQPEPIREGHKTIFNRYDGSVDNVPMRHSRTKMTIRCDDLEKKGLPAVLEAMDKATNEMAEQQSQYFIERLNEICKESRQVYDAEGRPLTFDVLLDSLDTIDIDFDDRGQPIMPTILAGRNEIEKIKNLKPTNEQNERFNEIIERKRSEWRSRESDRRLAN